MSLPDKAITVAHRSDGSGTTSNFTKYLTAAAPSTWKLGSGDTVAWPSGTQGAEKNTGVAQIIKQTDGAIGYVDFSDAVETKLNFAAIKNKDGKFVAPSLEGATAALAGATVKDDLTYDPLNAAGADAYPITAPTYLLLKNKYDDANKAKLVKGFVRYAAHRRAADRQGRQLRVAAQRPAAEGPRATGQGPELTRHTSTLRSAFAGAGSTDPPPRSTGAAWS